MSGITNSVVTNPVVTNDVVTSPTVTGPPPVPGAGDILLIDDGGDALIIEDATSDNRLIED